jgi:hypothetical protein
MELFGENKSIQIIITNWTYINSLKRYNTCRHRDKRSLKTSDFTFPITVTKTIAPWQQYTVQ